MKVILTIGASGSGKSTFVSGRFGRFRLVCPDDIRRELTGNVSGQSRNAEVWQEAYRRLADCVASGTDCVFCATNLSHDGIRKVMGAALDGSGGRAVEFVLLCFEDSRRWRLCERRVRADIESGSDRSRTCGVFTPEGVPLIKSMSGRYAALMRDIGRYAGVARIYMVRRGEMSPYGYRKGVLRAIRAAAGRLAGHKEGR